MSAKDDCLFYDRIADTFNFVGSYASVPEVDPHGVDANTAFVAYDSTGNTLACNDPEGLRRLQTSKATLNAQIKMWGKGIADGLFFVYEIGEYLADISAPDWVMKAIQGQAYKFGWLSGSYKSSMIDLYKAGKVI